MQALKRKKRSEQNLEQVHGALSKIEMQRKALQEANMRKVVHAPMGGPSFFDCDVSGSDESLQRKGTDTKKWPS